MYQCIKIDIEIGIKNKGIGAYWYQKVMLFININVCQYQNFEINRHQWVAMPMDIDTNK